MWASTAPWTSTSCTRPPTSLGGPSRLHRRAHRLPFSMLLAATRIAAIACSLHLAHFLLMVIPAIKAFMRCSCCLRLMILPCFLLPQIDPENEQLLQQHLACAAAELPLLLDEDTAYFGARVPEIAAFLQSAGAPPYPTSKSQHVHPSHLDFMHQELMKLQNSCWKNSAGNVLGLPATQGSVFLL